MGQTVKVYERVAVGPHADGWVTVGDDGEVFTDDFGDTPVVHEVPLELWQRYEAAGAAYAQAVREMDACIEVTP